MIFGIMIKSKVIKRSLWNFFAVDELPDAFKMDSGAFEAKFGFAKPAEDATIVTHWMMGGRAGKAAAALKEMGYPQVYNYKGSFKDWVAKGGAVEK